jgi:hypothetical protein
MIFDLLTLFGPSYDSSLIYLVVKLYIDTPFWTIEQFIRDLITQIIQGVVVVVFVWHDLQLPVQSVPITTDVVSLNPIRGEVY